ncbi:OLC1v1021213C1 [Oldenlandia corymbosa var. corymbosa]|uniref:OLC1v1021213C1 n=1 Tax=Oldenlandia corymbosa var. corymbosa TaxID=529605 RepID=A0AAV1BV68_OLDCO|nr:OLC1v1021213C1 [Oldenlandia corymbosa var. corymbosa]
MAITRSARRRNWGEMPHDLLVKIFALLNFLERMTIAAGVCSSWRAAAADDPSLTKKMIDVALFRENAAPELTHTRAQQQIDLAFARAINLTGSQLLSLVFDPLSDIRDKHLKHAAHRCPKLEQLVLPFPNAIKKASLNKSFQSWPNLRSLSIPFNGFLETTSLYKLAGSCFRDLVVLKVSTYIFPKHHFKAIAKFIPNLEILHLQCHVVETNFIVQQLSAMPELKHVYISCLEFQHSTAKRDIRDLGSSINGARNRNKLPSLQLFHHCNWNETECEVPQCNLWI